MKTVIRNFGELEYLFSVPDDFSDTKKYPVLIFLHGAGTRSNTIQTIIERRTFGIICDTSKERFVIFAPHCRDKDWYAKMPVLDGFLTHITDMPFADTDRVYLTGNSMGGYGTWELASQHPTSFAAIIPICGGGTFWKAPWLKKIPIWIFHGALDLTVPPEESLRMLIAVNKHGGNAKLTLFPYHPHNCWTDTYAMPEIYDWLLSHKLGEAADAQDEYKGEKFG